MFLLAHIGITMAAGKAGVWVLEHVQESRHAGIARSAPATRSESTTLERAHSRTVDFRFLLFGAVLPDDIDKPLQMVLANGRTYSHTLLFALLLLLAAVLLPRRARPAAIALFLGDITHLTLDEMWHISQTLLWPIFGFAFPRGMPLSVGEAIDIYVMRLVTDRFIQVTEALGAVLIIIILVSLLFGRRTKKFLLAGDL